MDCLKICKRCKKEKPHRRQQKKNCTIIYCKECEAQQQRCRFRKKKESYVSLLGGECQKCGLKDHPCIYDFHHLPQFEKTNVIFKMPKKFQKSELKKCELLCGYCHRKHRHSRPLYSKTTDAWKKCSKCHRVMPHARQSKRSHINTPEKRIQANQKIKAQMVTKWHIGEKIFNHRGCQEWSPETWKKFCEITYGFGSKNASDYERLYQNYSLDNLPISLNAMRHPAKKLLNPQDTTYVAHACRKCCSKLVADNQERIKKKCVEYKGEICEECSIRDDPCIYDFHHRDPSTKDFKISSLPHFNDKMKSELDKCVLLCCHCHRKIHASVILLKGEEHEHHDNWS